MASPTLPQVERISHDFADRLLDARDRGQTLEQPLGIYGPATVGKTATLETLRTELLDRDADMLPLMVGAPPQAPDAAPLVLMQLAEGLGQRDELDDSEVEHVADPQRPWADKVELVRDWLHERRERVVVLCDEPLSWRDGGQPEFAEHVEDLWDNVLFDGVGCSTVVAGRAPRGVKTRGEELAPQSDASWLLDQLVGLRRQGEAIQERLGESLDEFSPLDVRLIVALAKVDDPDRAAQWYKETTFAKRLLAARLFERMLVKEDRWQSLVDLWAYLACVRRPFDESLLAASGYAHDLEHWERAVLYEALLFPRGGRLVLHETLRASVLSQRGETRTRPYHEGLADYFAELGDDDRRVGRRLDSMDAFDHASRAGRDEPERFPPFFIDQLNLLGYRLSRRGRREEAADVFLRALKTDPENDYANHYRAFNLDLLGTRPHEVECRYREAVRLNDRHAWWHSRLISFLVVRGRLDAARDALESALPGILPADREPPPRVYREVHLDIAANLVHRGQLVFASELLDLVPEHIADQLEDYDSLRWVVSALRHGEEHGQYVPLGITNDNFETWWVDGPYVVPPDSIESHPLVRWLAGTVEGVDDTYVYVTMAEVRAGQDAADEPSVGELVFTFDQLETWRLSDARSVLRVGDFLEFGFYGEAEQVQRAAKHPRGVGEVELPRVLGDPNRFLVGGLREG